MEQQIKYCKCGCGTQVEKIWVNGHWNRIGMKEVVVKKCLCGCGVETKNTWIHGHHSRVNNISKREDIKELRRISAIERHKKNGFFETQWNKGLTKETDERVANYGKTSSKSFSKERKEKYSKIMRENRLNGTVPTLRKEQHSQWNGGTSSLTQRIRASNKLYKFWKYPILCRDGFKCTKCNETKNLEIHHDKERFYQIKQKCINVIFPNQNIEDLSWEEQDDIIDLITVYHVENKVSGITLCENCHDNSDHSRSLN